MLPVPPKAAPSIRHQLRKKRGPGPAQTPGCPDRNTSGGRQGSALQRPFCLQARVFRQPHTPGTGSGPKSQSDQLRGCLTPGSLHQEADASKNARDGCPSSRIKCNLCSLLQSAPGQEPFGLGLQNACSLLRSPGGHSLASASLKSACRKAFAGPAQGQCRCPDPAGHRHCDLSDSGTCCQETVTAFGRGHWRSRRPPRPASRCGYCPPCQSAGNRA